jgi:hypothetical protein
MKKKNSNIYHISFRINSEYNIFGNFMFHLLISRIRCFGRCWYDPMANENRAQKNVYIVIKYLNTNQLVYMVDVREGAVTLPQPPVYNRSLDR